VFRAALEDIMTATFHDLTGKSVYITGGGSGIGAALTDGFLAQGANVAFIGRSDASAFVAEMAARHGRAPLFLQGDITDTDRLQATIAAASEAHGPVDVLVSNAANDARHTLADLTPSDWDALIAVNLKAYFFAAQAVAPAMQARGSGSIINFSSISYMMGNAGYPAYTAANGAITALTRSLARELGPEGVRVNALAPGWVLTQKQLDKWATPRDLAAHLDRQCLKTHLEPADVVGGVLFLASDISRMMTGQCMVIDGGVVVTG
jgi:NAD(P)-dependent dehydrogenase (short-subunit alcohol dehydrogenase family)